MSEGEIDTYVEVMALYALATRENDQALTIELFSKRFPCPFCKKIVSGIEAAKRGGPGILACPHCGEVFGSPL